MSGGKRHCYYNGVNKVGTRWFCNKCYRKIIAARAKQPEPKKSSKKLSSSDLKKLYLNLKRSGNTIDPHSSKVLINEILPALLLEVMKLRGVNPPEEK